jgi:SAM-dependent methyltransferase
MSSSYRNTLDNWLGNLNVTAEKVLDIGGAQEQMKRRVNHWEVKEYVIADLPDPHKGDKPDIELDLNLPIRQRGTVKQFDMIFCLEVMEYIWNPVQAHETIARYLKPTGSAWVSYPSFYPLHQPIEDDALRYMPSGIKKLAENAGLKVIQLIPRRPDTNVLEEAWSLERMRAAKGEDHRFTGWIVELRK